MNDLTQSNRDDTNADRNTGEAGSHPVGTGLGASAGALTGATVGTMVAGSLGTLVGGVIGAVTGGLVGKEVAENVDPTRRGAPENHPVGSGVGVSGGAIAGATLGSVAGSLGAVVGAGMGAVTGSGAGQGAAEVVNPKAENDFWRANYMHSSEYIRDYSYVDCGPAYQYGVASYAKYPGRRFDDVEANLASDWERAKATSRMTWQQARSAPKPAWHRVERAIPGHSDGDGR